MNEQKRLIVREVVEEEMEERMRKYEKVTKDFSKFFKEDIL